MKMQRKQGPSPEPAIFTIAVLPILVVIFLADTLTEYAVAAAVFYTAVILFATRFLPQRSVIVLALICLLLTVFSFLWTKSGAYTIGLINTGISVVAIAVTTYLGLRLVAAEAAAHETRERLLRLARVTSIGELTTSIAHEINQPLTSMVTSAGACQRWLAQDPPNIVNATRALDRIVHDANRASEVIARVRGLTRGEAPHKSLFDFNDAVLEIVGLARGEIDRHEISVEMFLRNDLPPVVADKVQIEQVVGNLLLNAVESITVSQNPTRILTITSILLDRENLKFSISDTGAGLHPDRIEDLFNAFWTTKKEGIGLGLTISRSIIEANGGRIWAEANSDGGAVFYFTLPIPGVKSS